MTNPLVNRSYVDRVTPINADWLNGVNDELQALNGTKAASSLGAGLIGFDPTLNYVAGTIGAKLYEANVCDYPWLAKGDGATNDYSAIAGALAWLKTKGGGRLVFPKNKPGTTCIGVFRTKYAIPLVSNVHYSGEKGVVLKSTDDSVDNVLGEGYPFMDAAVAARAAGGTFDRLKKPDFLTNYTEQEALVNGGFAGYARTGILVTDLILDGNKSNCAEGSQNLMGAATGTFLSGETVTSSSGGTSRASGVFGTATISINPLNTVGTFNIGNTVTGSTSGATMVIASKGADDAYQLLLRMEGVSHSVVRNCEFRNSVFEALSLYDYSNNNLIEKNFFHDNNKSGTVYTSGWLNIYVEFDANHNVIRDNLIVGGLSYSILVSCPNGTNRDTWIVNNTIYNPGADGIRIGMDGGTSSIFGCRVLHNTVVGASAAGATGIRIHHEGTAGAITDTVIANNTVRDSSYGILFQGRVQYSVCANNTARNNTNTDIDISGATLSGNQMLVNASDSVLTERLSQQIFMAAGAIPLQLYSPGGGQDVGIQKQVSGVGTWYEKMAGVSGNLDYEFGGTRKASITSAGDIEGVNSAKGGAARMKGLPSVQVSTSATTIATLFSTSASQLFVVAGDDGVRGFVDLVLHAFGTVNVVSSNGSYGAPPARTYSRSGTNIQLALAAGPLGVRVTQVANEF